MAALHVTDLSPRIPLVYERAIKVAGFRSTSVSATPLDPCQ